MDRSLYGLQFLQISIKPGQGPKAGLTYRARHPGRSHVLLQVVVADPAPFSEKEDPACLVGRCSIKITVQ